MISCDKLAALFNGDETEEKVDNQNSDDNTKKDNNIVDEEGTIGVTKLIEVDKQGVILSVIPIV